MLSSVKIESKSMFSSFRIFTLLTQPGNYTVNRTRADFKWLAEKLATEFPSKQVSYIVKADLNKKVIEDYFFLVIGKENMHNSKFLNYFLTANDHMFKERKNIEEGLLESFKKKFKKPAVTIEGLGISSDEKSKKLTAKEHGKMELFLDEVQETLRVCGDVYKQ